MTFRGEFEHRDELLRAALTEFRDRGYDAASVNRILALSGMSKGQLYHHFGSKQGLFLALVEWMIDQKVAWFASHPVEAGEGLIGTLRAYVAASVAFATDHPDVDELSRALLAERGRPIFAEVTRRFGFDADSALGGLVEASYERGELRDDVSLDVARRVVLLVVNHLPDLLDLDQPADLSRRIDQLMAFLRSGLLAP